MKGLAGATLRMWVVANGTTPTSLKALATPTSIKTAYINLCTFPGSKLAVAAGKDFACTVLLENPVGKNLLSHAQLIKEV